jgi:hypothetical protein
MANNCYNKTTETYGRHKWEISEGNWKDLPQPLTLQIKHCTKCGCYDFQWVNPEERCPACGKQFKNVKGMKGHPNILLILKKWDFPVCNECASKFMSEILKKALKEKAWENNGQ